MRAWIARDLDGDLYLHLLEPKEDYVSTMFWRSGSYVNVSKTPLDKKFAHLPSGSKPIPVTISG